MPTIVNERSSVAAELTEEFGGFAGEPSYRPFANQEWRNALQSRVEVPMLARLLRLPRCGSILEIGCGRGVGLVVLQRALSPSSLVGIDVDESLLRLAAERTKAAGVPARLLHADVRNLPFEDGAFDLVVDFGTCYHIAGKSAALREIQRVLAPGGQLVYESPLCQLFAHPWRTRGRRLPWHAVPGLEPVRRAGFWSSRGNAAHSQRRQP